MELCRKGVREGAWGWRWAEGRGLWGAGGTRRQAREVQASLDEHSELDRRRGMWMSRDLHCILHIGSWLPDALQVL